MELLSLSTPLSSHSLSSSLKLPNSLSKLFSFLSLRPFLSPPFIKSSLISHQVTSSAANPTTLTGQPMPSLYFSASAMQSPATAMRGAESDATGLLLRERIVFLGNQIDDFVADAIISQLLLLDAQDPNKDIRLFVNSVGGSLSATMAIYDVVKLVRADVAPIALGISASTASVILAGGTKGKRLAMPNLLEVQVDKQ